VKICFSSIKLRLLIAFLVSFVAVQFGLVYVNLNILEQNYASHVERHAPGLGMALQPVLTTMMAEKDYAAAWQVLDEQRRSHRMVYFLLYGSDGSLVAQGGETGIGAPPANEGFSGQDGKGDRLFHTGTRLSYAGGNYGELRYAVTTDGMAAAKSELVRRTLLVNSAAILAIAVLLGFTLRYWLTRELRGLTAASESIAAGNFNVRVQPPESTEFAVLADAFNRMSSAINARMEDLRESTKRLNAAQALAHIGSWELDMVGNKLTWSDEIYRIFEIAPESFGASYESFLDAIHPEDREMVDKAYAESVDTHAPYDIVHRLRFDDERIKFVRERGEILYADSGKPYRSIGTVQDITKQEMARKALQESERYQAALLANLPVAVVVHLPDDTLVYGNAKAAALFGLTEDQARSLDTLEPSWRFLAEDGTVIPEQTCPIVRAVLESGKSIDNFMLGVLLEGSGKSLWLLASGYPDFDGEGRLRQVVVSFVDITARRQAEYMLRETRSKLQQIVDVSPAAIYVVKLGPSHRETSHIVFLSRHIASITGYGLDEWEQQGFWEDHVHPEDRARVLAAQGKVFESGSLQYEYRFLRRDGTEIWILDRRVLVRDKEGRPTELVGAWLDITEQRQAVDRLKLMNRLHTLLSRVNEAIIRVADAQTLLQEVCRIAVEEGEFVMAWVGQWDGGDAEIVPVAKWGSEDGYLDELCRLGVLRHCPTAAALRQGLPRLVQDIDPATAVAPWCQEALKRGYRAFGAFPIRRGGEVVGSFNLYADTPGFFSDDIVRLVVDMTVDVSFALEAFDRDARRREAEEEVRRLNEELEQRVDERTHLLEAANKELESFSYSVSHDLRAPLRSIDGFSQILLRKFSDRLDDSGKDYLNRVSRASQRMGELIDDLLKLSRVSRADLKKQAIDLGRIASDAVQELRERQPARRVDFALQGKVIAEADGRLMRVALDNLLGNAWKFTGSQEKPRIEFGLLEEEGKTIYYVRDNGAGFDMQYAHKLFGPFQRLHKEEEFEGSGIGLATVQRIVSRHGGKVWAEGTVGKGAAFYFTL